VKSVIRLYDLHIMKRKIIKDLIERKDDPHKKSLILRGVSQSEKTYILKHLGERYFPEYHYFNFEKDTDLHQIFQPNLKP